MAQAGGGGAVGLDQSESTFPPFLQQSFCQENIQHNEKQFYYIRSVSLSLTGSVCGLLGLTNLSGFIFFIFSTILINSSILIFKTKSSPSKYDIRAATSRQQKAVNWWRRISDDKNSQTKNDKVVKKFSQPSLGSLDYASLVTQGLQENAFSFILWWTFWYGIVHVYD